MTTAKPPIDIPPLPPSVLNYQLPSVEENKATTNGQSHGQPLPPTPPRRKFWGLRPKLITSAIALATLPLLGVGLVGNEVVRQNLVQLVLDFQQQQANSVALQFENYLRNRLGDARTLGSLLSSRYNGEIQRRDRPQLQAILDQFLGAYSDYDSAGIITNDGQGTVIAQSSEGNRLANNILQNQQYFKLAIQTRNPVLTVEPTLSLPDRPLGMFLAVPVINPQNGQILAVARLRIPRATIAELFITYTRKQYHTFYLIDSGGTIFATTQREEAIQGKPLQEVFPKLAEQLQRARSGVIKTDATFEDQILSYRQVPSPFRAIVLGVDRNQALAPLRTLTWTLFGGMVIATGAVGAIALYATQRGLRPIFRTIAAVEAIGAGNLDTRVPIETKDELATLGQTINEMVTRLQQSFTQIEQAAKCADCLRQAAVQLSELRDRQAIFETLVAKGRELLACDRVIVYAFDDNYVGTVVAESVAEGWPQARDQVIEDPCFREHWVEAYRQGRIQATTDIFKAGLTECHLNQLRPLKVRANLVVPMLINDQLFGLLIAHQCSEPRQWQEIEIDQFSELASTGSLVLERLHFLEQTIAAQQAAERLAQEQQQRTEHIQMQLIKLLTEVEAASQGDLTVRADITADEIGTVADIFNALIESLRDVVVQVKATTEKVNTALLADEAAMTELATESLRQAKKVKRMLDAVEAMASSIESVANSANEAAAVARQASERAVTSGETMDTTVESILQLRQTVAETAKKVKRLGESSQQISKVISLINQIALQTNLLAINASIEAARAGEEGRGFAVVAEEVGELAARSAAATREIEQIVESIQQETQEVVSAMEAGTAQVVEGTRLVEATKQSLAEIVQVSQHIDELVQSISQATVSQTRTSNTVSTLMRDFAKVSEGMSATSKQISESLQATVDMAQELQNSVNIFKVTAEG